MGTIKKSLLGRTSVCKLCSAGNNLHVYPLPPVNEANIEHRILVCSTCLNQIKDPEKIKPNHWRCLNGSIWRPIAAVQVTAWRM